MNILYLVNSNIQWHSCQVAATGLCSLGHHHICQENLYSIGWEKEGSTINPVNFSIMNPIGAQWIELYYYLKDHPQIMINTKSKLPFHKQVGSGVLAVAAAAALAFKILSLYS